MPFNWRINITKNPKSGGPAIFTFEQIPPQVQVGDQVFWSNQDTVPHWPATADNPTEFMSNQIAATSTSPGFSPNAAGTISYICSLHKGESGTIQVAAAGTSNSAATTMTAAPVKAPGKTSQSTKSANRAAKKK